jgi:hypothetical protein
MYRFVFSVKFLYNHVLKPHQKVRIDIVLGITTDLKGKGYNVNQSKIAIGSGKLWGKGYMQGTQTKYSFVPEQSTDFIFCTVGEEWGFAGAIGSSTGLIPVPGIAHHPHCRKAAIAIYAYLCLWGGLGYILPRGDQYRHDHRYSAIHRYPAAIHKLWWLIVTKLYHTAVRADQARLKPYGYYLRVTAF